MSYEYKIYLLRCSLLEDKFKSNTPAGITVHHCDISARLSTCKLTSKTRVHCKCINEYLELCLEIMHSWYCTIINKVIIALLFYIKKE